MGRCRASSHRLDLALELRTVYASRDRAARRRPTEKRAPLASQPHHASHCIGHAGTCAPDGQIHRCSQELGEPTRVHVDASRRGLIGEVGHEDDRQPEIAARESHRQMAGEIAGISDNHDRIGANVEQVAPELLATGWAV